MVAGTVQFNQVNLSTHCSTLRVLFIQKHNTAWVKLSALYTKTFCKIYPVPTVRYVSSI